jgi:putative ABC transport system ATP-binding protein
MNIIGLLDRPPRAGTSWTARTSPASTATAGDTAKPQDRVRLPELQPALRTTALENVELPLLYNGGGTTAGRTRPQGPRLLEAVGLGSRTHHTPSQLSEGSSSGWRWPRRS